MISGSGIFFQAVSLAQQHASQQSVQPTCGSLLDFQVVFWLGYFSASE
jgi:hypothetical protein